MGMLNKRLCFTINQHRALDEIRSYRSLLTSGLYQGIEIFYPYDIDTLHQDDYRKGIFELCEEHPEVVLHLPFGKDNDLCCLESAAITQKRLLEAIDYGKQFHVKKYTLHLGYIHKQDRGMLYHHLLPLIRQLCDATEALIMIENMPKETEMGVSPEEIKAFIDQGERSNLSFIFDTGHANLSGYTIRDYMKLLYPHLTHMHLSDNRGEKDEHKPIGTGTVDFKTLIDETLHYSHLYCLEIIYQTVEDLKDYARAFYRLLD